MAAHHTGDIGELVLQKIKEGSGTRYNPELVEILLSQSDLSQKIRDFAEKKWAEEYYEVFKKNFFDRDNE